MTVEDWTDKAKLEALRAKSKEFRLEKFNDYVSENVVSIVLGLTLIVLLFCDVIVCYLACRFRICLMKSMLEENNKGGIRWQKIGGKG